MTDTNPTPQDIADALVDTFYPRRFNIHRVELICRSGQGPACIVRVEVGDANDPRELSGTGADMASAIVDLHNSVRRWLS